MPAPPPTVQPVLNSAVPASFRLVSAEPPPLLAKTMACGYVSDRAAGACATTSVGIRRSNPLRNIERLDIDSTLACAPPLGSGRKRGQVAQAGTALSLRRVSEGKLETIRG